MIPCWTLAVVTCTWITVMASAGVDVPASTPPAPSPDAAAPSRPVQAFSGPMVSAAIAVPQSARAGRSAQPEASTAASTADPADPSPAGPAVHAPATPQPAGVQRRVIGWIATLNPPGLGPRFEGVVGPIFPMCSNQADRSNVPAAGLHAAGAYPPGPQSLSPAVQPPALPGTRRSHSRLRGEGIVAPAVGLPAGRPPLTQLSQQRTRSHR